MKKLMSEVLCTECRSIQPYDIHTEIITREWNGKKYTFNKRIAICKNCGQRVTVPGLEDLNEAEFEIRCRTANDYIQIDEIQSILQKYDIEKRPLSRVLGLGEHTIENYLKGQLPSKRYSDMLKRILVSSAYLMKLYEENHDKLNRHTAEKVERKLEYYKNINSYNSNIETVALYILNSKYEITNMSLQKLLYYIEAFAQILLNVKIFNNRCEAWMYGPVYPVIYEKYKSFGNSQITVDMIDLSEVLSDDIRKLIDFVLSQFAIYNGVTLKDFSHSEAPWINAHDGYGEKEHCTEAITHEAIEEYFSEMHKKYNLSTVKGVKNYISSLGVV